MECEPIQHTCDNNVIDIICGTPLSEVLMYSANIIDVQETTFWSPEEPRIVLDGITFCRRVDDGEHLFQVLLNELFSLARR